MPSHSQLSDRVATRIQGLSLWTSGMKLHEVMKITGLTSKTLYNIRKKAIERGDDPKVNVKILASYVQDDPVLSVTYTISQTANQLITPRLVRYIGLHLYLNNNNNNKAKSTSFYNCRSQPV